MSGHSDSDEKNRQLRRKIIGLGERSTSKSYYPELRKRLDELEAQKKDLEEKNLGLLKLMNSWRKSAVKPLPARPGTGL